MRPEHRVFTRLYKAKVRSKVCSMSARRIAAKTPRSRVKIVIICEDIESGKHAKELQDHVLRPLSGKLQCVPEAWTFRALQHPELHDLASKEIQGADIIVFSTRANAEVPSTIKELLETRPSQPHRPRALVALVGPAKTPPQTDSTRLFLEAIAAKGQLDLFFGEKSG